MGNKPDRIWATGLDTNGSWSRDEPPGDWDAGSAAYVRADLYDALRAQVEAMRGGLKKIAFMRPAGPTPKTVKGELIERIETIALAALAKPTGSPDGQQ